MRICRIQDADGRGPWKPGTSSQWVEDRQDLENLPPFPVEFFGLLKFPLLQPGECAGTGCQSIAQLRRWFTPQEYATLRILGYRAVWLNVDRVIAQSDKQTVFARRRPLNEAVSVFNLY